VSPQTARLSSSASLRNYSVTSLPNYSPSLPPSPGFTVFYHLSPLESAHPRPPACNPCRMNTSKTSQICIKTKDFNPIRMNTSKTSRRAKKTKDFKSTRMNTSAISDRNPFRIRTSKKEGGGGCRKLQRRTEATFTARACRAGFFESSLTSKFVTRNQEGEESRYGPNCRLRDRAPGLENDMRQKLLELAEVNSTPR
jgi:hypothetical protein